MLEIVGQNWMQATAQVLGVIGATAPPLYKFIQSRKKKISHASLKNDLDLLGQLDAEDPNHAVVKKHIDWTIAKLYSLEHSSSSWFGIPEVKSPKDLAMGLFMFLIFGSWTVYILTGGLNWSALVTGIFAIGGFQLIVEGFIKPSKKAIASADASSATKRKKKAAEAITA